MAETLDFPVPLPQRFRPLSITCPRFLTTCVFADELLDLIPAYRLQDVTYFNPADAAFPIGYNVLGGCPEEERARAASSVVAVFNAVWNLSLQNPPIHSILGNGIAALMESKNAPL